MARGAERTEPESRLPRWLQSASCFVALRAPLLQHPQGAECVPAARRAEAFQLEVRLPLVRVLQRPAAVLVLAVMDDVDGVGEARVARRVDGVEIVESAEDVVVSSWREREANEYGLDDFAGPVRAKEPVYQEELTAAPLRFVH